MNEASDIGAKSDLTDDVFRERVSFDTSVVSPAKHVRSLFISFTFADHRGSKQYLHIAEELRHRHRDRGSDTDAGGSRSNFGTTRKETAQERLHNGLVHLQWALHEHSVQSQQLIIVPEPRHPPREGFQRETLTTFERRTDRKVQQPRRTGPSRIYLDCTRFCSTADTTYE